MSGSMYKVTGESQLDMLASVSHSVRTPIHTIMGMADLALEDAQNPEAVERYLRKIKSAGNLLIEQINELLEIARIEHNEIEMKPVPCTAGDIREMAEMLVELYSEDRKLDVEINVEEMTKATFLVDKVKLEQIFGNLISNAVKYTPDGGKINFTGETLFGTERQITNRYTVSDTGIGMDKDFCEQVFLPFARETNDVTANVEGTGLGLYMVQKLVWLMNGSIKVSSEPGKGTTFVIEILNTVSESAQEKKHVKDEEDESILKDKRILLCEDNDLNAEMTKELLENAGILVDCVCNGKEAVEQIKNMVPYYYDAVLMDIRMPVMDGLEATRQIRKMDREDTYVLPIVALTANAYDEDYRKSLAAGMDAHLTKPFSIKALLQQLAGFWRVYKEQAKVNCNVTVNGLDNVSLVVKDTKTDSNNEK